MSQNDNLNFKDWYTSLPANLQISKRNDIIDACEISQKTFYRWVNGEVIPKKPYQDVINTVAKANICFTSLGNLTDGIGLVK